jgi:acetyltransferase-like isoleucine patch superfamily enzyme
MLDLNITRRHPFRIHFPNLREKHICLAPFLLIQRGKKKKKKKTDTQNSKGVILDTPVADVIIGEECSIGPRVTIIGVGHPVRHEERLESITGKPASWGAKVVIGDGVWIGAGALILPGVTIGSCSTIGAGSVVTKDLPPRCVAMGNPASVRYYTDSEKGRESVTMAGTALTLEEALMMDMEEDEEVGM